MRSTTLSLHNKIRIFNTNVKSVLLYGSESWRVTKTNTHKLQTFTNRCLRNILSISIVRLNQENIKDIDKFVYLGSVVSKDGGTDEDIKCRINKALYAFNTLRPIWRSTALSLHNKIQIFNTNVKLVLLYGSET